MTVLEYNDVIKKARNWLLVFFETTYVRKLLPRTVLLKTIPLKFLKIPVSFLTKLQA